MKPTDFAGTNARIRVFESNLLKNDQFERMLQSPNFEEALSVLKDTPYRNDVEELKRTKNYDMLLVNELKRMYEELFTISPEPALIELFSLRYSYHNLKVMLKENLTQNDFSDMLIPIGKESLSSLKQAVETEKSDELNQEYLNSIQEVKTDYEEYHNVQSIDIILDRRYFTHLKHLAESYDPTNPYAKVMRTTIIATVISATEQDTTIAITYLVNLKVTRQHHAQIIFLSSQC